MGYFVEFLTSFATQTILVMSHNKKTADASDSDEEEIEVNEEPENEPEVEEDATLANPDVVTKYQEAAKIAQFALREVMKMVF